MFKIYDGRTEFYQWDLNRKLIVADKSITQVHFCNRTGECSLLRDVYEVNGMYLVDVPNILLQDNWDIKVYGFDSSYTKHSEVYNVVARTRPENYVYTEVEQLKWEQLEARIDEIEENGVSDETIAAAVESYIAENGVEVDLTGYATETYVQEQIAGIEHPVTDLSNYYNKTEVDEKIEAIDVPETDLTDYYTKSETEQKIAEAQLGGGDVDLSSYYTKTETDTAIKNAVDAIDIPETDLSNYYNKQEVDEKFLLIEQAPDMDAFAEDIMSQVNDKGYALKTDIPDVSGFLTEVPAEYITETELAGAGYQTEAQVLALITANLPASGEEVSY